MSFDYFYKFSDKILNININIFWNHFQKSVDKLQKYSKKWR